MPARLVRIARLDQLAAGRGVAFAVAGDAIALFRVDGQTFAIADACARCGTSLARGTLRGANVACSGCDWEYDVRTGAVSGVPALRIDTFEVTVVDSVVMLAVEPGWPPNA
ncbi:nitrite reductase (NADH) small subunit [Gammaproteobacteria bacterium]|jgi:nitrite reductase/ring-hydroxylating ferredoxin subunit|nr:nitrite reductase (NAD(P)H) small subunit [Betaproteobacteria bacterium]CAG0976581.1 nitrite reductase (NADH) small subunit [Gammaproteobacteria bacterium]